MAQHSLGAARAALAAPFVVSSDNATDTSSDDEGNARELGSSGDMHGAQAACAGPSASLWSSTINLAVSAVGAGILSLPNSLSNSGYVLGPLLITFFGITVDYSLVLLFRCGRACGETEYDRLALRYLGNSGAFVVKIALMLLLIGALVTLVIIFGDLLTSVMDELGFQFPAAFGGRVKRGTGGGGGSGFEPVLKPEDIKFSARATVTIAAMAAVFPLTLSKSLTSLRFVSLGAVIAVVAVTGAMALRLGQMDHPARDVKPVKLSHSIFLAMPVQFLAYCCQFNILPLYNELPANLKPKMPAVIHTTVLGIMVPLYAVFALLGYFSFGDKVHSLVLDDYSKDMLMTMMKAVIAFVNLVKLPLLALPTRQVINETLFGRPELESPFGTFFEMLLINSFVTAAAIALGDLRKAFDLVGSTSGVLIMFTLPGLFAVQEARERLQMRAIFLAEVSSTTAAPPAVAVDETHVPLLGNAPLTPPRARSRGLRDALDDRSSSASHDARRPRAASADFPSLVGLKRGRSGELYDLVLASGMVVLGVGLGALSLRETIVSWNDPA